MDWFYENREGTTEEIASLLYKEADTYHRNRVASVLRALELKGLIGNTARARWRIDSVPEEVANPEMQERRIQKLEARLIALEVAVGIKRTGRDS